MRNGILRICRLALALLTLCSTGADEAEFGAVEGYVRYRGKIPKSIAPDSAGVYRDLVEVDAKTGGLKDALVILMPTEKDSAMSGIAQSSGGTAAAVMDQLGDCFVPHLLAVRDGQEVTFSNSDPANHNVRSTTLRPENQFNVFVGSGGAYRRKFQLQEQDRPIQLGCDIHPWMRAWIYVFNHPFFAVTDDQGRFKIASGPVGTFRAAIVQPDLKYRSEQTIVITRGGTTRLTLTVDGRE